MAVEGIRERFSGLAADAESLGGKIKDVLAKAAEEINALFGTDSHPAQTGIIQRLEQAAHLAITHPAFAGQAADPTSGQSAASSEPTQQQAETGDSSPSQTSDAPSTSSEGTSQP